MKNGATNTCPNEAPFAHNDRVNSKAFELAAMDKDTSTDQNYVVVGQNRA